MEMTSLTDLILMGNHLWLYRAEPGNDGEFVLLVNWRRSSSRRHYDAITGKQTYQGSGQGNPYHEAFPDLIRACRRIEGLDVKVVELGRQLDQDSTNKLRLQVSLPAVYGGAIVSRVRAGGMLDGVDQLVERALRLDGVGYRTKKAAIQVTNKPPALNGLDLIDRLYNQVEQNWDGSECRSRELWRWRPMLYISDQNTSVEKTLEKAIVNSAVGWVNQIPAASGLLVHCDETHVSVDLAQQLARGEYEFIELKIGASADTPLRAAFEIVSYGLLYCFARLKISQLGLSSISQLLKANIIHLKVLGPLEIYSGYQLGWLSQALDFGLREFTRTRFGSDLTMGFAFEAFPAEFTWPGLADDELQMMLQRRMPLSS
jgi:hypothetical protein